MSHWFMNRVWGTSFKNTSKNRESTSSMQIHVTLRNFRCLHKITQNGDVKLNNDTLNYFVNKKKENIYCGNVWKAGCSLINWLKCNEELQLKFAVDGNISDWMKFLQKTPHHLSIHETKRENRQISPIIGNQNRTFDVLCRLILPVIR